MDIPYKIIRSRRRTIALVITQDAELVVRAPLRAPLGYIKDIVGQKSDWIRNKLQEISESPRPPAKEFADGEEFFYLGNPYKLCFVDGLGKNVELKDKLYISTGSVPQAREILKKWYKLEALKIITERCRRYQGIAGCQPTSIRLSDAKKRWGSCGRKGTLNFSWRLIMAPLEVIDYLVVHELAHIGQLDHSRAYWDKVRSIMPDYKIWERWLKQNNRLLAF